MNKDLNLFPHPEQSWSLDKWVEAAGLDLNDKVYAHIVNLANELNAAPGGVIWKRNTISNWIKRCDRVPSRDDAIGMIKVLREAATRNRIHLFDNKNLEKHSQVFLTSNAMRYGPWEALSNDDIWDICKDALSQQQQNQILESQLRDIRLRVLPQPPDQIFGRDDDILRVRQTLENNLVSVIDAPGGEGKTALAWYVTRAVIQENRFRNVDWTTDKRHIIAPSGQKHTIEQETELALQTILKSMVRRFGWHHLYGVEGELLENGCADELRKAPYLVIVDNLETIENASDLLYRLENIFKPISHHTHQWSRALVTSRKYLTHHKGISYHVVERVHIDGIAESHRVPYLQHLQTKSQPTLPLTDNQLSTLALVTHGNPLLMQIAIRRYTLLSDVSSFDEIIANLESGKDSAFPLIFGDLVSRLDASILALARAAASEAQTNHDNIITTDTLGRLWKYIQPTHETLPNHYSLIQDTSFIEAIEILVNNCILSRVKPSGFNMHPLIQRYLIST